MTTTFDVVTQIAKRSQLVGLGQTLDGGDANDILFIVNEMLGQWASQRWMVYSELDLSFVSTGQTTPYTVGPGGNYNITSRPDRIEAAYLRQLINPPGLNVDTPLKVIPSREEYSTLSLKPLESFPLYVFLDTAYPTGNLYIYPWPNASIYETHILVKNVFPTLTLNPNTTISLPPQYVAAIIYNGAQRARQAWGKSEQPSLNKLARSSLDIVKQSNLQVPELVIPSEVIGRGSGYNIFSDQFGSSSS